MRIHKAILTALLACGFAVSTYAAEEAKEKTEKDHKIAAGDKARDFEATTDQNEKWKLSDHLGKDVIVLYFYPADMTGGCTKQACGYRDNLAKLEKLGAMVVGVSGDSVKNHQVFKKVHDLNFTLLADEKGEIASLYGIPVRGGGSIEREVDGETITLTRGVSAERWTVVIGKNKRVEDVSKIGDAGQDPERVIEIVKDLESREPAKFNKSLRIGDPAPRWEDLEGTDGKKHSFDDHKDAKVLVAVVTCNTCPVAQAYQDRLKNFAKEYAKKGVDVVAINVNTDPGNRLEKMKERAKEEGFTFPYLYDPSQEIAHALGATVTPHWFVFDENRRVRFMGSFDDHMEADRANEHYVSGAVDALLEKKTPTEEESRPVGCGVKYDTKSDA